MTKLERLELRPADVTRKNVEAIAALFPNVVTEARDEDGELVHRIDFEALRQELDEYVIDGKEAYQIDWPGKLEAEFLSNTPTAKTLRPNRPDSVDFDTTRNLFIEGDNLEALKLLQESYLGKVRLIYIDPPYNTGSDLVYHDDFASSKQEYLWKSGQVNDAGEKTRREHERERTVPLGLAQHDLPASSAREAVPCAGRRHPCQHRRCRAGVVATAHG